MNRARSCSEPRSIGDPDPTWRPLASAPLYVETLSFGGYMCLWPPPKPVKTAHFDQSKGSISFTWDHVSGGKVEEAAWSVILPNIEAAIHFTLRREPEWVRVAVAWMNKFWSLHRGELWNRVLRGEDTLVARIASPVAPFTSIPPDALKHFTVTDWWNGVAKAEGGERVFSMHIVPGSIHGDASPPRGRKAALVIAFVLERFPQGLPADLTFNGLAALIEDHIRKNSSLHPNFHVSVNTVRTALRTLWPPDGRAPR